jgi:hypothetical protein
MTRSFAYSRGCAWATEDAALNPFTDGAARLLRAFSSRFPQFSGRSDPQAPYARNASKPPARHRSWQSG